MRLTWCIVLGLVIGCGARPKTAGFDRVYTAGWLDVSVGNQRYYALYCYETAKSDGSVIAASGVLLMPWDDRPHCAISREGANTMTELRGQKTRFVGRPLLLLASSDSDLKVIADDLELSKFGSSQTMTEMVTRLLAAHKEN